MFEKEAEEAIMKKYPSSVQGYKSLIKNWKEIVLPELPKESE